MLTIFTISFSGSSKTYDYLVLNPEHYTIDATRPLRIVIGASYGGMRYSAARVVRIGHPCSLPGHITAALSASRDNVMSSQRLSDEELRTLRALKPAPMPKAVPARVTVAKTPTPTPAPAPAPKKYVMTQRDVQLIAVYEYNIKHARSAAAIATLQGYIEQIKEGKYEYIR